VSVPNSTNADSTLEQTWDSLQRWGFLLYTMVKAGLMVFSLIVLWIIRPTAEEKFLQNIADRRALAKGRAIRRGLKKEYRPDLWRAHSDYGYGSAIFDNFFIRRYAR